MPTQRGAGRWGSCAVAAAVALVSLLQVSSAAAYWSPPSGSGVAAATTGLLAPPTGVTVPATSGPDVAVTWIASAGPLAPTGYFVTRALAGVVSAACGTSPTSLVGTTSCTDTVSAAGSYTYRVTAVHRTWTASAVSVGAVSVTLPYPGLTLGAASSFSVLGSAVTNGGPTVVEGDVGSSPMPAITGFTGAPLGTAGGTLSAGGAEADDAELALLAAYADALTRTTTTSFAGDQNGATFVPGVHSTGEAFALTGVLTLDGEGDPNSVFIFKVDAALNTAANSEMVLINGARAENVFWQANGAAGTGADSTFQGTILAKGAITIGARGTLIGRALATGAVTLDTNVVRFSEVP